MKKYILLSLVVFLTFTGCKKDDGDSGGDTSMLVGRWEAVSSYVQNNGTWGLEYNYKSNECVYIFTPTHITINDKSDLLNGETIEYKYASNVLTVMGMTRKVYKLTATELELEYESINFDESGRETSHTYGKTVFIKK